MKSVTVDGARLAYAESGPAEGEPVVLLHGYPADHRSWRNQIPELSKSHRVIALDWLGWGESERSPALSYDYGTEVERIGRVLDALGLTRVNFFAHDYGGFIGLGFAERHPERLLRLAILNSRAHRSFPLPWFLILGATSIAGRWPLLRSISPKLPLAEMHARSLAPLGRTGAMNRELIASWTDWMRDPEAARFLMRHNRADYSVRQRRELSRDMRRIGCPTAVVWGRDDQYLSPRIPEQLAAGIPGAELTLLDAGHFVMEEAPAEVNAALLELLERP